MNIKKYIRHLNDDNLRKNLKIIDLISKNNISKPTAQCQTELIELLLTKEHSVKELHLQHFEILDRDDIEALFNKGIKKIRLKDCHILNTAYYSIDAISFYLSLDLTVSNKSDGALLRNVNKKLQRPCLSAEEDEEDNENNTIKKIYPAVFRKNQPITVNNTAPGEQNKSHKSPCVTQK